MIVKTGGFDDSTTPTPGSTPETGELGFESNAQIAEFESLSWLDKMFWGFNPVVGFLVFYLLAKGWLSNVVVKRFSAVVKYVIYATAVVVTYIMEISFFGTLFDKVSFIGTAVVTQGVCLFADGKNFVEKIKVPKHIIPIEITHAVPNKRSVSNTMSQNSKLSRESTTLE